MEISCEKVTQKHWQYYQLGSVKTCWINSATSIQSQDVKFSTQFDEEMSGLWLNSNNKINYLPINVGEKFPNLLGYDAAGCSLTEVLSSNFRKLSKLKELYLNYNQIERVNADTFDDMTSLEVLHLRMKNLV
jgi:Leucine rich repeat